MVGCWTDADTDDREAGLSRPDTPQERILEVTGYPIIQPASLEEAKSMPRNHLHLAWTHGCCIDVHECFWMSW